MDKKLTGGGAVGKPSPSPERMKDIMRRRSLRSVKISLVLFLLGAWAVFAPPVHAQHETLTGWFSMTIADYPSESGLVSEITYVLTEDSGERHELLLDVELMRPLGGPVALNRKRVTVGGVWEQSGAAAAGKFRVSSIELAASPEETSVLESSPDGTSALQTTSQAVVTGAQAWVTILCRFADATDVTPYPVSHYERMMGSSYPGLEHYWREVSYGNIPDLRGSVVVGWYNLPRPRSYYVYDQNGDGEEDFESDRAAEDCIAVADADVFFPDFDGINLVFNQNLHGPARGGGMFLTLDGKNGFWGLTWLPDWAHENQKTWAHEMGHGFGLQHSSGPYDETYDSQWDVMSGGRSLFPYPGYGYLGVHTIAYHKDFLGWIPAGRKYVAPRNSTRTITLEQLAQPGSEGYLMAEIPIGDSDTDFYTVEARLFAGYDNEIPDEAVVIHKVDTTLADRLAQVVDVDNNGDPNDAGAMWTPGEIFTDTENNLQVSIEATYSSGYLVTINTNLATFSTCIDFLSSSSHIFGPGRDNASVQVEAASDCDWSATSHTEWIRVTSGGRSSGPGSVSYAVTTNSSPTARTGALTIAGWTFTVTQAGVNDSLFEDDMESGTGGWTESSCKPRPCSGGSPWARTTASSRSGRYAWTDSPDGNYQNDQRVLLWSPRSSPIDLTQVDSATLTFWHRYDFGSGDRGNVWVVHQRGDGSWWTEERLQTFTGTHPSWQQTSIDLTPFVGEPIRLAFQLVSDASETADGWYIDDVAVYSSDFETTEPPPPPQARLENPSLGSSQSGIGIISGWACEAQAVVIELNGTPVQAAYGTPRGDTQPVCGDTDNGFSLLVNWNNLGDGQHVVRALVDGVEFARTTVQVTTFGVDFLRGVSGTFDLPNFPSAGATTVIQWAESQQNFVLTDGQPGTGGGYNRVAGLSAVLENPSRGSPQSGIGVISGWACEAQEIVIELAGTPVQAAYGTPRGDTRSVCGDANNGFSLLVNWSNLGAGQHTIRALVDGVEFARTTVRVTTFGVDFLQGVSGTFDLPNFPSVGATTVIQWEESLQNFVIIP